MKKFREVMDGKDLVKVSAFDYETVRILTKDGIIKKDIVTEESWFYGVNSNHYEQGGNEEEFRASVEYKELKTLNRLGDIYIEKDVEYLNVTEEFYEKFVECLKKEGMNTMYTYSWYTVDEDEAPYCDMDFEELEKYRVYAEPDNLFEGKLYYLDLGTLVSKLKEVEFIKVNGNVYLKSKEGFQYVNPEKISAYCILDEM